MKISDKLKKVNDEINITRFDNGYTVRVGGKQDEDEWGDVRIVCTTLEQVLALVKEYSDMELDS